VKTKRTGADLEADAKEFAKQHPDDVNGSLALASKLEAEAKAMKEDTTMTMRTVNRLLRNRFENLKRNSK
jgi:hypothetical protein